MFWNKINQRRLYEISEELRYVDIIDDIALKHATIYMGNGIEFKSKDPKIHEQWHKMLKRNKLDDVMFFVEKLLSRNGAVFLTINRNAKNEAMLNITNIWFPQFANKCFATSTQAVIYEQFNIDNQIRIMRSYYDTEKVERYIVDKNENRISNLQEFKSKLPEEYQIQLGDYDPNKRAFVYYHNCGFVPVQVMVNEPLPSTFFPILFAPTAFQSPFETERLEKFGNWDYSSLKDTARCKGLIEVLQVLRSLQVQNAIIDKTRAIAYGITESEKDRNDRNDDSWLLSNTILNAGYGKTFGGVGGVSGSAIEVLRPANNLLTYDDAINNVQREIYNKSGLSFLLHTANQKTAEETASQHAETLLSLYRRQTWHTKQWVEVIEKMFMMENVKLKDGDWSFQAKKNNIIDEAYKIDNIIKKIQAGADTPVNLIAVDRNVDEDMAQQIWEENKKWFDKNDYQIQMKDGKGANWVNTKPPLSKEEKGGRKPNDQGVK